MSWVTASRGNWSAPPRAARPAPRANTAVNSAALVDPERCDHLPVLGRGAHQDAEAGAAEQEGEGAEHRGAERDQHQLVLREALAQHVDRADEVRRARPDQGVRAPDDHHQLAHDQHHAEGREQLEQFGRLVDPAQQQNLDQGADAGDHGCRQQEREPEAQRRSGAAEPAGQADRQIGAQHVERAVGEVHDPGDAEDDREPGRDQEQGRRAGQTVQDLDDEEVHDVR